MLSRIQHIAVTALCVVAACCLVLITRHALPLLDSWNGASTLKKANDTLDAISGPRGTLHEVNKAVVKMGDAVVTTQLGERRTFPHVIAATDALTEAAHSGSAAALAVSGTADQATATLRTTESTVQAFQPLAASLTRTTDASTRAVQDFDDLVKNPMWEQMGQNVVGMTHSGDLILADGSRVSKKFADDYTRKQTPWMRIWRIAGDTYDLAAFGARHTP